MRVMTPTGQKKAACDFVARWKAAAWIARRVARAAYGVAFNSDEGKIVAHLFKLYAEKMQSQ